MNVNSLQQLHEINDMLTASLNISVEQAARNIIALYVTHLRLKQRFIQEYQSFHSKRVNLCQSVEKFSSKLTMLVFFLSSHENMPSERKSKNLAECDRCYETMEEQTRNEICVKPNKCQRKSFEEKNRTVNSIYRNIFQEFLQFFKHFFVAESKSEIK